MMLYRHLGIGSDPCMGSGQTGAHAPFDMLLSLCSSSRFTNVTKQAARLVTWSFPSFFLSLFRRHLRQRVAKLVTKGMSHEHLLQSDNPTVLPEQLSRFVKLYGRQDFDP
jgi:hypothetical protein